MELIHDTKKLKAAIKSVGAASAKFNVILTHVAASCLGQVVAHNNVLPLQDLHDTLNGAANKAALVLWSEAFGKVKFDSESGRFAYAKSKESKLDAAIATPVLDYKPAKSEKPNLFAMLKKLDAFLGAAEEHLPELSKDEVRAYSEIAAIRATLAGENVSPIKRKAGKAAALTAPQLQLEAPKAA